MMGSPTDSCPVDKDKLQNSKVIGTVLNNNLSVQECDATRLHSSNIVRPIKKHYTFL